MADLDQMPVGIAQVAADLLAMILGRREERRAFRAPVAVNGMNVGDTDVERATKHLFILRRRDDNLGLIVGRFAADVQDQPAVADSSITGSRSFTTLASNSRQ